MQQHATTFYLSSAGETDLLAEPRKCTPLARLRDEVRDDHMLVAIEPALMGQSLALVEIDVITEIVLSSRHEGQTLFPVSEWPAFVYVARILDRTIRQTLAFSRDQVELIAWATIFATYDDALRHAREFQREH